MELKNFQECMYSIFPTPIEMKVKIIKMAVGGYIGYGLYHKNVKFWAAPLAPDEPAVIIDTKGLMFATFIGMAAGVPDGTSTYIFTGTTALFGGYKPALIPTILGLGAHIYEQVYKCTSSHHTYVDSKFSHNDNILYTLFGEDLGTFLFGEAFHYNNTQEHNASLDSEIFNALIIQGNISGDHGS